MKSKLIKDIKGGATQTFQIRFLLVYLGLLNGDKSNSSILRMIIFGFLLFSSLFLGYYYLFGSIVIEVNIRVVR
jgi:hypothetical protein